MQSFRRFERSSTLFIGLLVVSFLLATFDVRAQSGGLGEVMRDGAQTLFSPLQKAATAITRPVVGVIDALSNLAGLREENERQRQVIAELEQRLQDTAALEAEIESLREALGFEPVGDLTVVPARIFSNGSSDFDRVRFIDKGSQEGITKGQAVIDVSTGGLVGRVDLVSEHSARVRLVTDPRMGVGIRNKTTGETGWVEGQGTEMRLEMFAATEAVSVGDVLYTDGSLFPPDIAVGTVKRAAESQAGFALFSTVEPQIDLSRLDYVTVVVGWSPLDAVPEAPDGETFIPDPNFLP